MNMEKITIAIFLLLSIAIVFGTVVAVLRSKKLKAERALFAQPTRLGKGVRILMPNTSRHFDEAVVVFDIMGDQYRPKL